MRLGWLKALLNSRKFYVVLVVAITAVVLYARGAISAEELVDALMALGGLLVAAIAAEDAAEKFGRGPVAVLEETRRVEVPAGQNKDLQKDKDGASASDGGHPRSDTGEEMWKVAEDGFDELPERWESPLRPEPLVTKLGGGE